MTTAAVVLAAGGGRRYLDGGGDNHKLLAPFMGWTVVGWAILSAVSAKLDATYVVTGAVDIPEVEGAEYLDNGHWMDGLATSLQVGVARAAREGHSSIVVGLGDQPLVPPEAWTAVAATPSPIAVATYDGRRRHRRGSRHRRRSRRCRPGRRRPCRHRRRRGRRHPWCCR